MGVGGWVELSSVSATDAASITGCSEDAGSEATPRSAPFHGRRAGLPVPSRTSSLPEWDHSEVPLGQSTGTIEVSRLDLECSSSEPEGAERALASSGVNRAGSAPTSERSEAPFVSSRSLSEDPKPSPEGSGTDSESSESKSKANRKPIGRTSSGGVGVFPQRAAPRLIKNRQPARRRPAGLAASLTALHLRIRKLQHISPWLKTASLTRITTASTGSPI